MMTAIAYTQVMTMFSMSSSVRNGFFRTIPGIVGGSVAYMIQMIVVYMRLSCNLFGQTLKIDCLL